jgi:hypothetical protein
MHISVKELFEQFTSKVGHKVIQRRQEEWRESQQGWDAHALSHMAYWTAVDIKKLTDAQAKKELDKKSSDELLKYIISHFLELGVKPKEISSDTSDNKVGKDASKKYDFSIENPYTSDKTIEQLLKEGYIGVDASQILNKEFVLAANKFKGDIKWIKTCPNKDGDVALMTKNQKGFEQLLDFMLDKYGWCPPVYSVEEQPDIFIFTPQNELEEKAIPIAMKGECGWQGSLYSLEHFAVENNKICLIFATKPLEIKEQEWLLVTFNQSNKQRVWSVQSGEAKQVYLKWLENAT